MPRQRPQDYDPLECWRFKNQWIYDTLHPDLPFLTHPEQVDSPGEKLSHQHFTPEVMARVLGDHFNLQGHVFDPWAHLPVLTPLQLWERQQAMLRIFEVVILAKKFGDRHYRRVPEYDGWSCLYCAKVVPWHHHYTAEGVARVTLGDVPCTASHHTSYRVQISLPSGKIALGNNLLPDSQVPPFGTFSESGDTVWRIFRRDVEGNAKNDLAKIPTQGGECFVYQIEDGYELRPRPLEGVEALGRVWAANPRWVSIVDLDRVTAHPEPNGVREPELVLGVGSRRIEVEVPVVHLSEDWVCRVRPVRSP